MSGHTFDPVTFVGTTADPYLDEDYFNHVEQGIATAQNDVNQEILDRQSAITDEATARAAADKPLQRFKQWISTEDYAYIKNEPCFDEGIPYRSIVDGNLKKKPSENIGTYWELVGGGGAGAGNLGYTFTNATLDSNITGWTPYMNTTPAPTPEISPAGTLPTGFGIAWNGTNPIIGKGDLILTKPAISCYGAGFYHDFHIDRGCLGTIAKLLYRFLTSANYVDGYLQMFILDKTNSNFIPVPNALPATYASISDWLTTFIPSAATEYRLYIHCATSTTTAWTTEFGGFELGRRDLAIGTAIGPNKTIASPSIFGSGGNPSKGTIVKDTLIYRQASEALELTYTYSQSAAGSSAGSGNYFLAIPESKTAVTDDFSIGTDSSLITKLGSGTLYASGIGTMPCDAVLLSNGTIGFAVHNSATSTQIWGSANYPLTLSGLYISVTFRIPKIAQQTSNVNLASDFTEYASNDGSGGVAAGAVYETGMVKGAGGSTFVAVTSSSLNAYTAYKVTFDRDIQPGDEIMIEICKSNGVWRSLAEDFQIKGLFWENTSLYGMGWENIGDTDKKSIHVYFGNYGWGKYNGSGYGGTGAYWSNATSWRWRVRKVSNGNMAEIPALVRAEYNSMASYALAVNVETLLSFTTKVEDTQTAYSSGTFVVPMDGVYDLEASFGEAAGATGIKFVIYTKVNDVMKYTLYRLTQGSYVTHTLRESVRVKKGDTIKLTYLAGSAINLNSDPTTTYFKIVWLGK